MKRYTFSYRYSIFPDIFFGSLYREDPKGEWFKVGDVVEEFDKYRIEHSICEDMLKELQEVNKELLEAMKGLELYARDLLLLIDGGKAEMNFNLPKEITNAQAAIAKAKGYR